MSVSQYHRVLTAVTSSGDFVVYKNLKASQRDKAGTYTYTHTHTYYITLFARKLCNAVRIALEKWYFKRWKRERENSI